MRDRGNCPCGHTEVLVERRLVEVQVEVEQLDSGTRFNCSSSKGRNKECMDASVEDWASAINGEKGGGT